MFDNYGRITRDQLAHEIGFALKNQPWDPSDPKYLKDEITYLMNIIDNYSSQDRYFQPLRELSVPEKAIYNLYNNYLIYNVSSKWNVKFQPESDPYELFVRIKTSNFYSSGKPLEIEMFTYRLPPKADKQIFLVTYDIDTKMYRNKHATRADLEKWKTIFGLQSSGRNVTYQCNPNNLAEKFFQLLNLARYVFDKSYIKDPDPLFDESDPKKYAKSNHIAKVYEKDDYGRLEKRIQP